MATGTRERIIEAAGNLFYERGFQCVGLDQILDVVGISKTALYKHFESKDEIIIAVLRERDRRDIDEAVAYMSARGGTDPRRQIVAMFDQLDEWFATPEFKGCLFMNAATEFPSPGDPIHKEAEAHAEHIAAQFRSRVVAAGLPDPDAVTRQLMLLMTGAIASRHNHGVADAAVTARRTVELLLGVSPRPMGVSAR